MVQNADIKIGLVDDHTLLRDALASSIRTLEGFTVSLVAENGKDFISQLSPVNIPEILLLDMSMPEMNGYETIDWIQKNHPEIKILVLTLYDGETLIHLIKDGVRGFLKKSIPSSELRHALNCVVENGIYCSPAITGRLYSLMKNQGLKTSAWGNIFLNDQEISFLRLVCSELTYREIAEKLQISPRTVDNYRDALFIKLNVKSRVGLVMYAVKSGIVTINH